GLDGDRFTEPADEADIGITRSELGGRVESSVGEVAHGEADRSRAIVAGVAGASSLFDQNTGRPTTAWAVRKTPKASTTTAAISDACWARRPRPEPCGNRSRRSRASTSASPTPPNTTAIPSPKITTRTNPNV